MKGNSFLEVSCRFACHNFCKIFVKCDYKTSMKKEFVHREMKENTVCVKETKISTEEHHLTKRDTIWDSFMDFLNFGFGSSSSNSDDSDSGSNRKPRKIPDSEQSLRESRRK